MLFRFKFAHAIRHEYNQADREEDSFYRLSNRPSVLAMFKQGFQLSKKIPQTCDWNLWPSVA